MSLLAPSVDLTFRRDEITIAGFDNDRVRELHDFIQNHLVNFDSACLKPTARIDTQENAEEYISRVEQALLEISEGHFGKVIPSRAVNIQDKSICRRLSFLVDEQTIQRGRFH